MANFGVSRNERDGNSGFGGGDVGRGLRGYSYRFSEIGVGGYFRACVGIVCMLVKSESYNIPALSLWTQRSNPFAEGEFI